MLNSALRLKRRSSQRCKAFELVTTTVQLLVGGYICITSHKALAMPGNFLDCPLNHIRWPVVDIVIIIKMKITFFTEIKVFYRRDLKKLINATTTLKSR